MDDFGTQSANEDARGFGLLEAIMSLALFAMIGFALYQAFAGLLKAVSMARSQIVMMELMQERIEIVRNLPFANVGEVGGIPLGVLAPSVSIVRGGQTFTVGTTVSNIDDPFDGTIDGTPDDLSPADYKRVEINVVCSANCRSTVPMTFTTIQAPKALESASTNGALFIRVLNASGLPVPNANVTVLNTVPNPDITIDDTTDINGWLKIIDAPPGNNVYQITATKAGYSTERTYPPGGSGLTSPAKPHATVSAQNVTQITFSIDLLGTMSVSTVNDTCTVIGSVPFTMHGAKTLGTTGTSPATTVYKYDQSLTTSGSGLLSLSSMEGDTYTSTIGGSSYYLSGSIPISPVTLVPGGTQSLQMVLEPAVPRALLVTVKDASTGLSVTGAQVSISRSSFTTQSLNTGVGFLVQTNWADGAGQANINVDPDKFFDSDGNVLFIAPSPGLAGELHLKKVGAAFQTAGTLTSSTFDTGSASNFHDIQWLPVSQATGTTVRMQVATNPTNDGTETWNFKGPDGTASTYYTTALTSINVVHDSDRYLRYRLFLSTTNTANSPVVSDVTFTFTSACVPPGQVMFTGLSSSSSYTYTVTVTKAGYQTSTTSKQVSGNWQEHVVTLSPQ